MTIDNTLGELLTLAKEGLYDKNCPTFRMSQLVFRLHEHMKNGGKLPTGWEEVIPARKTSGNTKKEKKKEGDNFTISSKMKVLDLDGNKVKIKDPISGIVLKDEYGTKMVRTEDQKVFIVQE